MYDLGDIHDGPGISGFLTRQGQAATKLNTHNQSVSKARDTGLAQRLSNLNLPKIRIRSIAITVNATSIGRMSRRIKVLAVTEREFRLILDSSDRT